MPDYVLVLNAGSSSLKFAVYQRAAGAVWPLQSRGQIAGIGSSLHLTVTDSTGAMLCDQPLGKGECDSRAALDNLATWLRSNYDTARVLGVGHRVVHGGTQFTGPTIVTPQVLAALRKLVPLAPLHQPHNLAAIEMVAALLPGVPQVACFDTSFHRGQPAVAELVPLPLRIRKHGVQRYGFHGLSYEYIASVLPHVAPQAASSRVIVAHLGSGASLCAMRNGKSMDSSFGFSALDGLCMATRPGALDPGVILYLIQTIGLSAQEVETLLYTQSGLLAISGCSSDMRDLVHSKEPSARLAVDYFVYRATKEIGALAAALGGVDALVFTGGIGENSALVRARICDACAWLGIEVDPQANTAADPRITTEGSPASAWLIPTNEELMIARHLTSLLQLGDPDGEHAQS